MPPRLELFPDYAALSQAAAQRVAAVIRANPPAALLPATGDTPLGLYAALAELAQRRQLSTERLRVFQLDEYLGLGPADRRSLAGWLQRTFMEPLGIPPANFIALPGDAPDPLAACRAYDAAVAAAGGLDLAILGLGPNGHLGYNEPPADADAPTRVVTLTASSLERGAEYWGSRDQVPPQALTAGMAPILAARQILLLVSGAHKRAILHRALEGPVSPDLPASFLQQAPNVTILADRAAWGDD